VTVKNGFDHILARVTNLNDQPFGVGSLDAAMKE
jgi:hypothetical protein